MYKRIAVAVDGSETSDAALDEAAQLAHEMGAALLLLHVCEEAMVAYEPEAMNMLPLGNMVQALADAGRGLLEKSRARLDARGLRAETQLIETCDGRMGNVISAGAKQWGADLLVVGSHGRTGIDRLLLGNVAEGVSRSADMPVLLVRARKQ